MANNAGPLRFPTTPPDLNGPHVALRALQSSHLHDLCRVGLDESLWKLTMSRVRTESDMREYIAEALRQQERGTALPYVIIDRQSASIVGSTRFGNMAPTDRRVEIGWTWIGVPWQRTVINTETKYLLLQCAFEVFGCARVEFKTDALNARSRRALERIGAREEGLLRSHMMTREGRLRDTVYFSVLRREWGEVKRALLRKMDVPLS